MGVISTDRLHDKGPGFNSYITVTKKSCVFYVEFNLNKVKIFFK